MAYLTPLHNNFYISDSHRFKMSFGLLNIHKYNLPSYVVQWFAVIKWWP